MNKRLTLLELLTLVERAWDGDSRGVCLSVAQYTGGQHAPGCALAEALIMVGGEAEQQRQVNASHFEALTETGEA